MKNNDVIAVYVTGYFATLSSFGTGAVSATGMGTKGDPLTASVTNSDDITVASGKVDAADVTLISGAVNAVVKAYSDVAFTTAVADGELADCIVYVSVTADNANTVYYKITLA